MFETFGIEMEVSSTIFLISMLMQSIEQDIRKKTFYGLHEKAPLFNERTKALFYNTVYVFLLHIRMF